MTATHVGGVEVICDDPTEAPIRSNGGQPVYWEQTRTLLLADGTVVYGCKHCDFTTDTKFKVRPHLRSHHEPKPQTTPARSSRSSASLVLLAREVERITADRDQWKARAQKAERSLATLRRALQA